MSNYGFLTNLTLIDTGRLRAPKTLNPEGEVLRIFTNGSVYPGKELVTKYNLEYTKRTELTGNGIDIIDSKEWEVLKDKPRMILIGFTSKSNAKVDIFGTCRYNSEDNTPKASVMNQGLASEKLLTLVQSMGYLTTEHKYADLVLLTQYPIKTQDGISFIPKVVERGECKGDKTYQRREDEVYYPLVSVEEFEAMMNPPTSNATGTTVVSVNQSGSITAGELAVSSLPEEDLPF